MKTGSDLIADIDAYECAAGECAFWWLGQQSFVVKLAGEICYIDPYLSPSKARTVAPLLTPEQVTNAGVVLGSHDHGDHIDRGAWPRIAAASPRAQFVAPKLLAEKVARELAIESGRVRGVDEGVAIEFGGVRVSGVPAAHEFLDVDAATGLHPYVGFVIEGDDFCLYHAGDTCLYEGMHSILRRWDFDLAFMPINGRDAVRYASNCIGNMTYQETADLAGAIRPGTTVPAHFEMFARNSQPPEPFVEYMRAKYPHLATLVPRHGERTIVKRARA
jgi:L-ascorbate 6-phosphate lactonase